MQLSMVLNYPLHWHLRRSVVPPEQHPSDALQMTGTGGGMGSGAGQQAGGQQVWPVWNCLRLPSTFSNCPMYNLPMTCC